MPTLRRYCRVSKYTVLECRIYLDNPADLTSWLLSPRYNILPRIFTSIKPLVLPKLHEEQDRAKTKGKKQPAVKDVVLEDDFEVSLFLTNSGTRHAVMTKRKALRPTPAKILSNSNKLTGLPDRESVRLEVRRESPDESGNTLFDIPAVSTAPTILISDDANSSRKRKSPAPSDDGDLPRKRQKTPIITIPDGDADSPFEVAEQEDDDDKKKLSLQTSYEGFNIYSRILCIVVKRRRALPEAAPPPARLMEEWINMSQAIKDGDDE